MSDCPNCSDGTVEVDDVMVRCPQCWDGQVLHVLDVFKKSAEIGGQAVIPVIQPTDAEDSEADDDETDEHPDHVVESAQRYVYQLADLMGLRGWDLKVSEEVSSKHTLAEIETVYGQLAATVWLGEDWEDLSPEMKRDTLVHELLHAHVSRLKYLVEDVLKAAGKKVAAIGGAAWHLEEEYTVEAMAQAWAPWLPVPFDGEAGA